MLFITCLFLLIRRDFYSSLSSQGKYIFLCTAFDKVHIQIVLWSVHLSISLQVHVHIHTQFSELQPLMIIQYNKKIQNIVYLISLYLYLSLEIPLFCVIMCLWH